MFHNNSKQEIIQKFISIDTTFIDLFGPNNNNSVMFGGANIACHNSMVQYPHSSTNAAILSKNYASNVPVTSLVAGINNRKKINELKSKIFKVSPSDFTIHLPETLTNVIQMKVCAVDLPHPIFNISPHYKNNYVEIDDGESGKSLKIELPSGSYTVDQIIYFLNKAIDYDEKNNLKSKLWRFFYNPVLGRVFFSLADNNDEPSANDKDEITLTFSDDTESCEGPKKYRSLGTILGFRKKKYTFHKDNKIYDYLHLANDFIVEPNGKSKYTTENGGDENRTCNWPDNSRTDTYVPKIEYDKSGGGGTIDTYTPQGFIAEGSPEDSKYMWLVIDDFVKEQKTDYMVVSTNRSEINSSKVYCKLPVKHEQHARPGRVHFDTSYFVDDYKREYFNPTNIDKLHIKLIDPSGLPVYFGHSNLNLDIQFSCLR